MMPGRGGSPPKKVKAPEPPGADTTSTTNDSSAANLPLPVRRMLPVWVPCTRPPAPQDALSWTRRRRAAAHRSVPLDCGCRDPWPCRCTDPPLSEHQIDGWRNAAEHVLAGGQMPVVPIEVRRALWRRGGPDRELAETLHSGCGQVVA